MTTFKKPKNQKKAPVKREKQILIYADFGCTTGFGNVMKELIDNWASQANEQTQFYIFALNNFDTEVSKYLQNVTVIPANTLPLAMSDNAYQIPALLDVIDKCDFDVIYFLNDIEVVGQISGDLTLMNHHRKEKKRKQFKTVFYFPIDSMPRIENLKCLEMFNEIVTFTDYAKNILTQFAPKSVSDKIQVLYHGVNNKDFYKLPEAEVIAAKEKLFGEDKIVFGSVNRNSARKDMATIVLAFADFYKSMENVSYLQEKYCLYLHCNPQDPSGVDLKYLAMTLGLTENKNIFFPENFSENKGFDVEKLNLIYNMFDCFITTSTAEGWGLTLTEAIATETPTIVPQHTSFEEITNHGCNCIPLTDFDKVVFVQDGTKVRFKSKTKKVADALHWFSIPQETNKNYFDKMVEDAKIHIEKYDWKTTADGLWKLINKYL